MISKPHNQFDRLKYSSRINPCYRTVLEKLFYYNPRQVYHINVIEDMVEKYGTPEIAEIDGYLEMRTANCPESRSLFISLGPVLTIQSCTRPDHKKTSGQR